jgi:hypothetical protein
MGRNCLVETSIECFPSWVLLLVRKRGERGRRLEWRKRVGRLRRRRESGGKWGGKLEVRALLMV